jgi:hypothetical protein
LVEEAAPTDLDVRVRMRGLRKVYEKSSRKTGTEDVCVKTVAAPLYAKTDRFTKTGSGQTYGKHSKKRLFSQVVAVNQLDLDLYSGQIFCLLGHNGAGARTREIQTVFIYKTADFAKTGSGRTIPGTKRPSIGWLGVLEPQESRA